MTSASKSSEFLIPAPMSAIFPTHSLSLFFSGRAGQRNRTDAPTPNRMDRDATNFTPPRLETARYFASVSILDVPFYKIYPKLPMEKSGHLWHLLSVSSWLLSVERRVCPLRRQSRWNSPPCGTTSAPVSTHRQTIPRCSWLHSDRDLRHDRTRDSDTLSV